MRRLIFALFLALAVAPSAHATSWTVQQAADLDRVSTYLNAIKTMRGAFTQIGPQGQVDQGKFYILKPGKIRFDYDPPNPTLVIGDGIGIAVYNTRLNTATRYPLSGTPLNLLLSDHLDLKRSSTVTNVQHSPGELIVTARASDRNATGNITIVFTDPGLDLRQWTIVDAQGLPTTVSINDVQQGVDLPESAFKINHK
ncbi:MAG TPA: outer membrane lipoprotein carrier protein LolA [Rhizomicrobium sp.]|nr:outer membrane lipoprotein carrier protein LolA [Rhizomicrobium sp.]